MSHRLAHHPSAYIRQHAEQPVDWYTWGPEALSRAQAEGKPLLVSVGYSGCHACEQMSQESFANPATARLMNEGFVNILIDREQRPDLDMLFQQAHGVLRRGAPSGWPLTLFCSPRGLPFYSGTWFPPTPQAGQPAFADVLASVSTIWSEKRAALAQQDRALLAALASANPQPAPEFPSLQTWTQMQQQAREQLATAYDAQHGGFGGAPKFAHPTDLGFLLHLGEQGDAGALEMALDSLSHMARGGLFDQLGGGFFRYSQDVAWRRPHFEKTLVDNAMLLAVYAQAYRLATEPALAELLRWVMETTVEFVWRDLRATLTEAHRPPLQDGLCAGLAAHDAQGQEGRAYLWESEPLRLALTPNEWDVCAAHWGLVDAPTLDGLWHLRVARPVPELARQLRRPEAGVAELVASARAKLLAVRSGRRAPLRDEHQATASNALMLGALAQAGQVLARPEWVARARTSLTQLCQLRLTPEERLLASPGQEGFLDDYAFLLQAVLALHQADPQASDLPLARSLAESLLSRFQDPSEGGFFFTAHDSAPMWHRPKPGVDTASPSGNGSAAQGLAALGRLLGETRYLEAARRCVQSFAPQIKTDPASHTRLLLAGLGC